MAVLVAFLSAMSLALGVYIGKTHFRRQQYMTINV
jgi:hypothetical protein